MNLSRAIRASIENGRRQYWCNLWSNLDFADKPLEYCVNLIHADIVKIWDPDDKNIYISSDQFKINISHIVKDLAVMAGGALPSSDWNGSGDKVADWVYLVYQGKRQESVRCVMGYIVNLIVILDRIFRIPAKNRTENTVQEVMGGHIGSGRRDSIHQDIRMFVAETFPNRFINSQRDSVLEKIIELIRQYCATP